MMIKRILVGIAGTPALSAKIECAIQLAQQHDAEIGVLSVVDIDRLSQVGPVPIGARKYARDLQKARIDRSQAQSDSAIQEFESACSAASIRLNVIRREGEPLKTLAAEWRHYDICLLGVRGWFDYLVMPEPRNALLGVLAAGIRPLVAVTENMRPVRRAVLGYHGSVEAARAMKAFVRFQLWPDMEIHIVCVGTPKSGEVPELLLGEAAAYCRTHGFEPTLIQKKGTPWSALNSYAADVGADMIVIGSSCRRMLLNRRFGKNAQNLLERSDLPLFLSN